jgi:hypothetical protein
MIQTINLSDFRAAFHSMGRKDQFSYEGLGLLFDYLEDFDGGGYELDVIALCCEYSEETVEQIADSYGLELPPDESEEEHQAAVRAYLEAHTSIVAEVNGRFLFVNF